MWTPYGLPAQEYIDFDNTAYVDSGVYQKLYTEELCSFYLYFTFAVDTNLNAILWILKFLH